MSKKMTAFSIDIGTLLEFQQIVPHGLMSQTVENMLKAFVINSGKTDLNKSTNKIYDELDQLKKKQQTHKAALEKIDIQIISKQAIIEKQEAEQKEKDEADFKAKVRIAQGLRANNPLRDL